MLTNLNASNNAGWYYQIMGATFGPVQSEEMSHLIAQGDIGRDTLVKPADHDTWYTADRFHELVEATARKN